MSGLEPEMPGDVVTAIIAGDSLGEPAGFEVQRILYSVGPDGRPYGRAVLLTFHFAQGSAIETLRVPLAAEDAARLAAALTKHARIVQRKTSAERS